jgi:pilus assembly protein CpaB
MAKLQEMATSSGSKGLLLLALLAGLVAAVIVFVIVSESDDGGGSVSSTTAPAVVASQQISAGTEITADMVSVSDVPEDLLVTGAFEDTELVVGETARVTIAQGEQLTSSKLGTAVPDNGLSGVIPVGKRGVAIEVDEVTAVGGLLLPGDRVDLIVAMKLKREPGLAEDEYILRTQTILQNVEVLAVAQEAQEPAAQSTEAEDPATSSGQIPDDPEEQPQAATLTVALDSNQSQIIISMQDNEAVTRVWAAERAFGDTAIVDTAPYDQRVVE